jgi:hypothetical protein
MLQVGRGTQGDETHVLLQPFAYGVANRSAGLAIDLFAVACDSAVHDEFRFIFISIESRRTKSPRWKLFRVADRLRDFLVKIA